MRVVGIGVQRGKDVWKNKALPEGLKTYGQQLEANRCDVTNAKKLVGTGVLYTLRVEDEGGRTKEGFKKLLGETIKTPTGYSATKTFNKTSDGTNFATIVLKAE